MKIDVTGKYTNVFNFK